MTLAFMTWLERLVSFPTRRASGLPHGPAKPMKIRVERMPDYLWRELGFPPVLSDVDRHPDR